MRIQTTILAAAFAAAIVSAGSASAQTAPRGEAFVMEMLGQRGWQVSCELSQADGDTITTRDHGRGLMHNSRVAIGEVVGGTCSYSVPERGELRLTVNLAHTGFECPFTVTGGEFCRANLAAGESGSFIVSRAPQPSASRALTN
ncbi:MAG: hypothetical protein ACI82N_000879 [Maricaulis sp.]|jgi:hypothetical protein